MANLISAQDRQTYQSALADVHDTFARPITVWRTSKQTITSNDPNYDVFSDTPIQANVTYTSESKVINARIKYIDRQNEEFGFIVAGTGVDVTQQFQLVRIKVTATDNEYIKDAAKITVDGQDFTMLTVPRPHGLFSNDYFTIYFRSQP